MYNSKKYCIFALKNTMLRMCRIFRNLVFLLLIFSFGSCQRVVKAAQTAKVADSCDWVDYNQLEIPRLIESRSQQVIEHVAYTVSFNADWNIPNWVAYSLTKEETVGETTRASHFYPDPEIKHNPVITKDYSHSGFDRGHMAPAADMKWSEQAMRESFYMTNICPQNQSLNRGDWNDLEELARDWARKYGEIFIACGPIVEEGCQVIGHDRKIVVPSAFYKVFLRKTATSWTSIGFVFPNQAGNRPLMTYMMSVNEVETMTGIDFFFHLPDGVEEQVEANNELIDWTV